MEVRRTYEYPLYRGKQNRCLDRCLAVAAEIWNHCIALHRRYYKLYGKHLSANKLKVFVAKLKKAERYKHWNTLGSQAIQDVVERIERSYKAFFDDIKNGHKFGKSPPKFRKASKYKSFTLKQAGYKFLDENRIVIMGRTYKYVNHRPFWGTVKTLTVKRVRPGEYVLFVSVIQEWPNIMPRTGNAVGLDFGLKAFLTLDNGDKIASPHWFLDSLDDIRKANRAVSRCKKGSKNRERALQHLELVHKRVANKRRAWFFDLANQLVQQYDVICVEDLNIAAMRQLWGRKVSDLAYTEFVSILEWVAFKNGSQVIRVSRWFPSSKGCHVCGSINNELTLKDRIWRCPCCGETLDRDVNAAINIRDAGMAIATA